MGFEVGAITNLRQLRPSRSKQADGDVFAMQFPDGRYLFGRVVQAASSRDVAPMPGAHLIYVYDVIASEKAVDPAQLSPSRLLLPPLFINSLPWRKGYLETILTGPMGDEDRLSEHCFRRWTGELLDENGREISKVVEPCGEWGLMSYRMLDDRVSDAIGIPRAPAQP